MTAPTSAPGDVTAGSRLAAGPRRGLGPLERIGVLLGYHWLLFRRTIRGVLITRFLLPVLFLASMGLGVGSLVDDRSGGVDGVPYLLYVVPGLVMVTAMQTAVGESTWPVMGFVKWNQFYRAMLNAPHSVGDTLRAHWLMIAFNVATSALAFTLISALFGGVGSWWALLGTPVAVLTGMAFSTPLFIIAAKTDTDSVYSAIFRLVVTPLMLFSGAFFPVEPPSSGYPSPSCGGSTSESSAHTSSSARSSPSGLSARGWCRRCSATRYGALSCSATSSRSGGCGGCSCPASSSRSSTCSRSGSASARSSRR
jgi:lipooligosaccharide transport system permease protein